MKYIEAVLVTIKQDNKKINSRTMSLALELVGMAMESLGSITRSLGAGNGGLGRCD